MRDIKNFGDVVAIGITAWSAFISALPALTTLLVFAYALMRAVNEWPLFYKTIRGWFKRK